MYNSISNIVNYSMPAGRVYNSCSSTQPQIINHYSDISNFISSNSQDYTTNSTEENYNSTPSKDYSARLVFDVDPFISKNSQPSIFVDSAEKIQDVIEEAFKATTGKEFPHDIVVSVCDDKKMAKNHPNWNPSISGFAVNSYPKMIFVHNNNLEKIMVTLGHEIGHVLSESLDLDTDEEAKAFSFCIAWIKAIKDTNIGNLKDNLIIPEPAHNGLHNVALKFVVKKIEEGIAAFDLFDCLARREVSSLNNFLVC